MATATSKISPVVTKSGRASSSSTYIATKVTGPDKNNQYNSEIVQYDNAKGEGAKTIGTRDPDTGAINWNDNASRKIKSNTNAFKKASNTQIESVQKDLATSGIEKEGLNKASGKKNQDITDGNTDSSQSKANPTSDESGTMSGSDAGSKVARNSYDKNLCYPVEMRTSLQDNLKIEVIKFEPRAMKGATMTDRPQGATIGSVILPIPGTFQDQNVTQWGEGTMTPADMAKANVVKSLLGEEGGTKAGEEIGNIVKQTQTDEMMSEGLKTFFTEQLTGTTDVLSRTAGAVMNPNMELLFKGPGLRQFTFSWKMSPRDEKESTVIAKIIRMFKQSMAPQKTEADLFLKSPSIYKLTFQNGANPHKFLPKIKTCALNNCGVNYTPDGSYMTYDNSSMVALEMSLSFQEMEPIYNNDMSHSDDSIGY